MGFGRGCPAGWLSWIFGLARVTEMSFLRRGKRVRFIPAGAGNTTSLGHLSGWTTVYPRWRGEHFLGSINHVSVHGLSPLARGTLFVPSLLHGLARFIPAGAGNTVNARSKSRYQAVYPRWRGEHYRKYRILLDRIGLSPLARGTHFRGVGLFRFFRFIPAGAGNTCSVSPTR